jgi:hypothetical protein
MFSTLRLGQRAGVARLVQRGLQTSTVSRAPGDGVAKADQHPESIIEHYGIAPFAGAVAVVLVSKEVINMDEEFLLACNSMAFLLTSYVAVGDTFQKTVDEANAAATAKFQKATGAVLATLNTYKGALQKRFDEVTIMKEFTEEQHNAAVAFANYQNAKVRHAAYTEMMAKLNAIKGAEEVAALAEFTQLCDLIVDEVQEEIEGANAAAFSNEALKYAIDHIGVAGKQGEHPVSKVFQKVLNNIGNEAEAK